MTIPLVGLVTTTTTTTATSVENGEALTKRKNLWSTLVACHMNWSPWFDLTFNYHIFEQVFKHFARVSSGIADIELVHITLGDKTNCVCKKGVSFVRQRNVSFHGFSVNIDRLCMPFIFARITAKAMCVARIIHVCPKLNIFIYYMSARCYIIPHMARAPL